MDYLSRRHKKECKQLDWILKFFLLLYLGAALWRNFDKVWRDEFERNFEVAVGKCEWEACSASRNSGTNWWFVLIPSKTTENFDRGTGSQQLLDTMTSSQQYIFQVQEPWRLFVHGQLLGFWKRINVIYMIFLSVQIFVSFTFLEIIKLNGHCAYISENAYSTINSIFPNIT
jgi:hypothetical protein